MRATYAILARILLPFHKRQPVRLGFLSLFSSKADALMAYVYALSGSAEKKLNVSGQTLSLSRHLSDMFDTSIGIVHQVQSTLAVGLKIDDGELSYVLVGIDADFLTDLPPEGDLGDFFNEDPSDGLEDSPGGIPDDDFDEEGGGFIDRVYVLVSLDGEVGAASGSDYQVIAPAWVDQALLVAEIEKYRLAGKSYYIVLT